MQALVSTQVDLNEAVTAMLNGHALWFSILALHLGILSHMIKKVLELQTSNPMATITTYLRDYRYQAFLVFVTSVVAYVGLAFSGELTLVSSFMTGYIANSLTDGGRK